MGIFEAVILGLVQGVTEFLPISSTGHLVLVREWLAVPEVDGLAFDALLHFATTAAVVLYFWSDLWRLLQTLLRKLGRLPVNEDDWRLLQALCVGTIPAVATGLLFESFIETYARSAAVVAAVLFVASVFFMYAEWRYFVEPRRGRLTILRGVYIGCFQILALLPGFSRAGATIAGGMLLGLSRVEASRFAFLLAIPITLGVGIKKGIDLLGADLTLAWEAMGIGLAVAFVTALIVIHCFLLFIRRYTLWPFVWYGIALSAFVAYVYYLV